MVCSFCETAFGRASVSFKHPSLAVVVRVGSHGLYIGYGFVMFWHGAKVEVALELGDVKQVIDLFFALFSRRLLVIGA